MNILVTRLDERGQELVNLLQQQQIFAIHQPLFTIESGRELLLLPSLFSQLNEGDYVFAVSKNAVDFASQTMMQTGFKFRSDLHYFSVGQRTATYFAGKSEQAVKYPICFENSEGLLELPEMQNIQGKNIVILRAETGREFFAKEAVKRGASVQNVECYRRVPSAENLSEKLSLAKRVGIDTIMVTSSEILSSLIENIADEDRDWLLSCKLVVIGQRIAIIAKQSGWGSDKIIVSPKADNQSILDILTK